jgi:hypothetical protein
MAAALNLPEGLRRCSNLPRPTILVVVLVLLPSLGPYSTRYYEEVKRACNT